MQMEAVTEVEQVSGSAGGLWEALAARIEIASEPAADLWAGVADRLDFSRRKPRRAPRVEEVREVAASGAAIYFLRNPEANTYLKMDDHDYFIWQRLDGERTVRDLAMAYFLEYKSFPLDRLIVLLDELKAKRMLDEPPVDIIGGIAHRLEERSLAYRLRHFADTSMQKEWSLENVDRFFGRLYRRVAWPLFTPAGLIVCGLLSIAGVVIFIRLLVSRTYSILQTNGSYGLGLLVLITAGYVMSFLHESGHALTVKRHGRTVLKGGFLLYYGSPVFFIDTTDIWMAPKRARVATSLAGGASTLILGGLLMGLAALFPAFPLNPVMFQAMAVGYVAVILNLSPFMELDGYYILMDWLNTPLLRKRSLSFAGRELPRKLREHTPFSHEERLFAIYGLLAAAYTVGFVWLGVYLWRTHVSGLVQAILTGEDILATILVSWLIIVAGIPLILGLLIKAILLVTAAAAWLRRRLRPYAGTGTAPAARVPDPRARGERIGLKWKHEAPLNLWRAVQDRVEQ
jgi:putative peptide zinc metalloprotease protein